MSITKEIVEDKIEIVGDFKTVQVRTATVIKEDGVGLFIVTLLMLVRTAQASQQKFKLSAQQYIVLKLLQHLKKTKQVTYYDYR